MSRKLESNQRPTDYKSVALPTELFRLILKNEKNRTQRPYFSECKCKRILFVKKF